MKGRPAFSLSLRERAGVREAAGTKPDPGQHACCLRNQNPSVRLPSPRPFPGGRRGSKLSIGLALALAACTTQPSTPNPQTVQIPGDNVTLRAELALPSGPPRAPAVVLLHGCGGPFPARDDQWRDLLVAAGHPVLLPDSFGSRGLGSQCRTPSPQVTPGRARRGDAIAAAKWLAAQPFTPPGGVVVMGWSNGGSTVLATARAGQPDLPGGLIRAFIAFYPGCRRYAEPGDTDGGRWTPAAPMLLLMGADDDWTPAAPCRVLAESHPDRIQATFYPGAYHDFDAPNQPVRERYGLASTVHDGMAHTGTNPPARADALRQVPAFLDALP